jgi:hypothetical protein
MLVIWGRHDVIGREVSRHQLVRKLLQWQCGGALHDLVQLWAELEQRGEMSMAPFLPVGVLAGPVE